MSVDERITYFSDIPFSRVGRLHISEERFRTLDACLLDGRGGATHGELLRQLTSDNPGSWLHARSPARRSLGVFSCKETGGKRLGPDKAKTLFDNGGCPSYRNPILRVLSRLVFGSPSILFNSQFS